MTKKTEKKNSKEYKLEPTKEKPKKAYRKGSKYDPPIDAFLESDHDLVEVTFEDKTASYLRLQFDKRIEARGLEDQIEVSTAANKCFFEKKKPNFNPKK